jgi:subtilisin family serine protease
MFFNTASLRLVSRVLFLATVASSVVLLGSAPVESRNSSSAYKSILPGEFLVKVRSASELFSFARQQELLVVPQPLLRTDAGLWFKIVDTSGSFNSEQIMALGFEGGILHVEQNMLWSAISSFRGGSDEDNVNPQPDTPPTLPRRPRRDPQNGKVWGLFKISAPAAWNISRGDTQVVVADIDSGVDYNHEDLINNIWRNPREIPNDNKDNDSNGFVDDVVGWDFYNRDNRPWDDNGHGTHTSGTLGATGGNGAGISGVSPRVSIMPLKFLSRYGSGSTEDAILAINYAVKAGAHILSNSWGGDEYSQALQETIAAAGEKNVLFVAAAGNDGTDNDATPMYPASYDLPNIVSVAASDSNDLLADFSNFGFKTVHLAAPGDVIHSTLPSNRYGIMSGTSMACPVVAGAAALLKAHRPTLSAVALKDILLSSVDVAQAYQGKVRSGGRLNVERALQKAGETSRY